MKEPELLSIAQIEALTNLSSRRIVRAMRMGLLKSLKPADVGEYMRLNFEAAQERKFRQQLSSGGWVKESEIKPDEKTRQHGRFKTRRRW